jgi:hypothetical protein
MLRLGLFGLGVACFAGSLFCIYLAWPTPPPDLWTERPVFDHGELSQGQEVQAEFALVNHFPQALEITQVVKGCACSDVKLSTKRLEPKEQATLQVAWKTGRMRGPSGVNVQVVFQLADGTVSHKNLRVEGEVVPDIRYEPSKLEFAGGKVESRVVQFSAGRLKAFTIRKAICDRAPFSAKVLEKDRVQVTYDPGKGEPSEGIASRLIVETDSVNEPEMIITLAIGKVKSAP